MKLNGRSQRLTQLASLLKQTLKQDLLISLANVEGVPVILPCFTLQSMEEGLGQKLDKITFKDCKKIASYFGEVVDIKVDKEEK